MKDCSDFNIEPEDGGQPKQIEYILMGGTNSVLEEINIGELFKATSAKGCKHILYDVVADTKGAELGDYYKRIFQISGEILKLDLSTPQTSAGQYQVQIQAKVHGQVVGVFRKLIMQLG